MPPQASSPPAHSQGRSLVRRARSKARRTVGPWLDRLTVPGRAKVLLLNYTGYGENFGCQATSNGLMRIIKQSYPGASIIRRPITYARPGDGDLIPPSPEDWDDYVTNAQGSSSYAGFSQADVVILNGEGSIHEWPNVRAWPEPYLRLLQAYGAARHFEKPVMVVNQTVDYWSEKFARCVKAAYQTCDYVAVRETRSLDRLRSLGLTDIHLFPDAAFMTERASERQVISFMDKRGIARGFIGLFLGENVAKIAAEKTQEMVKMLRQTYHRQVVLFAADPADVAVGAHLNEHLGAPIIGLEASSEMIVGMLSQASIVLSGRFHACVFAALAETPLVSFRSNTYKMEGQMEMLGYPISVLDYEQLDNGEVLSVVNDVWERRKELSGLFAELVPKQIAAAQKGYPNILCGH